LRNPERDPNAAIGSRFCVWRCPTSPQAENLRFCAAVQFRIAGRRGEPKQSTLAPLNERRITCDWAESRRSPAPTRAEA
jgi:hypothetical protein